MTHYRVQRGGTWFYRRKQQAYLRLAYRRVDKAHHVDDLVGFRVVCLPPEVAPPWMPLPLRGGSWGNLPGGRRSASRSRYRPGFAYSGVGFRVVCLPREEAP
jgi:formylglycine-generating enzyme required for sulfatase activity